MPTDTTPNVQRATAHTPGPWETGALMTLVQVLPPKWRMPMCIADCGTRHAPASEAERVANARLIAAAPDLLTALHRVRNFLWSSGPALRESHCMAVVEDAIASATGE